MKQFVLTVMAMLCLPLFAQIDCYCDLEIEVEDTISLSSIANVESPDSNEVFQAVDEMPEFPGGMEKLIQLKEKQQVLWKSQKIKEITKINLMICLKLAIL